MKLHNELTSVDQRFFFPNNDEAYHHESINPDNFPQVHSIGGDNDHYVVVRDSEGKVYAKHIFAGHAAIMAGSQILQVTHCSARDTPPFLRDEELKALGEFEPSFAPIAGAGVRAVVELTNYAVKDITYEGFDDDVAILPADEPLPDLPVYGKNQTAKFRLHGFITPKDRFVTWFGRQSYDNSLVDWAIANHLAIRDKNPLEMALLCDDIPFGAHLVGMLSTHRGVHAYLKEYDKVHKTSFVPDEDPRLSSDTSATWRKMNSEQLQRFRSLTALKNVYR